MTNRYEATLDTQSSDFYPLSRSNLALLKYLQNSKLIIYKKRKYEPHNRPFQKQNRLPPLCKWKTTTCAMVSGSYNLQTSTKN